MRRALLSALLLIAAGARPGAAETNAGHLAEVAGGIWDAAHAKDPGRKVTPEQEALFKRIDALTRIKSFKPAAVATALGLKARFEVKKENEYTIFYEARESSGAAIEAVDLRVRRPGTDGTAGFIVVDVAERLDVEPQDLAPFFGREKGVSGPGVHARPRDPYYYHYPRPNGTLKLGFRPGEKHVLVEFVWSPDKDE